VPVVEIGSDFLEVHVHPVLLRGMRGNGDHLVLTKGGTHLLDQERKVVLVSRARATSIMDSPELGAGDLYRVLAGRGAGVLPIEINSIGIKFIDPCQGRSNELSTAGFGFNHLGKVMGGEVPTTNTHEDLLKTFALEPVEG